MANISLSQSMYNISSSFSGMRDLSLTTLSTLSSSIGTISYSAELSSNISFFKDFNQANTNHPASPRETTHNLNNFNGYDHYKNFIFRTGSDYSSAHSADAPDIPLADGTYGDSNLGHNPYRSATVILSSSGEPMVISAYRDSAANNINYNGHVIKGVDSGAFQNGSSGGTGSFQRLTIPVATSGVTNGAGVWTYPIGSGSALILMRNQNASGKTYGQFLNADGTLTALTAVHTAKSNNATSPTYTNFSESAVAFLTYRGNMESKPSVVRKSGITLYPHIATEPTKPSGYSGFNCGAHGTLLAYRSGSTSGTTHKFFYACFHSYGGNYKSNALFYADPTKTTFNSATNAWTTIASGDWTLVNDDWKSQTAVKGSSNVGDFVGKAPNGDDWVVWFSLVGGGDPNGDSDNLGQMYCHSARITQADSVTITDLSHQIGLSELTGSRRYTNGISTNAGGRCWQHFNIISKKDVTTEFVLHWNTSTVPNAHIAHYNFDCRTGDLSLISELSASTRNNSSTNGGQSSRYHPIPKGDQWNNRSLYDLDGGSKHFVHEYQDYIQITSKSGWIRGVHLETS